MPASDFRAEMLGGDSHLAAVSGSRKRCTPILSPSCLPILPQLPSFLLFLLLFGQASSKSWFCGREGVEQLKVSFWNHCQM